MKLYPKKNMHVLHAQTNDLARRIIVLIFTLVCVTSKFYSQLPPGHEWKKVTYREKDLLNNPVLTQATSGDEWWYNHKNLLDANGNQIGYVAVGYVADVVHPGDEPKMRQVFNEGANSPHNLYNATGSLFFKDDLLFAHCTELYDRTYDPVTLDVPVDRTEFRGMVARLDMKGNMIWCRVTNIDGEGLQGIAQVGNYIYVAGTHRGAKNMNIANNNANRAFLSYNPTASNPADYFDLGQHSISFSDDRGTPHMYVAKFHIDGTKQWEAIYGYTSFSNPSNAWNNYSTGNDLIFHSNGSLYACGRAGDPATGNNPLFIVQINPANGYVIDEKIMPLPSPSSYYENSSHLMPGSMYGYNLCETSNGNMAVGCKAVYNGPASAYVDHYRGMLYSITSGLLMDSNWPVNPVCFPASSGTQKASTIMDVSFHAAKQEVLVGLTTNCDYCFGTGNQVGEGEIHRIKASDGSPGPGTNPSLMGQVNAFDLRVGVVETSDGGFAGVSSRLNGSPPAPTLQDLGIFGVYANCSTFVNSPATTVAHIDSNPYNVWDTDPLVVKFDASGNKLWEWSEDVIAGRTIRQLPPGDFKRQECMYKITETQDKGLAISGNCSFNYDDNYMVKLYSDCNISQPYTLGSTDITTNTTWIGSMKIIGKIVVKSGAVLTITGSNTRIQFADSKMTGIPTYIEIEPGGKLEVLNAAELTSIDHGVCPGSMWDGIAVLGNPSQNQGPLANYNSIPTQGFLYINGGKISNARCAINTGKIDPLGPDQFPSGSTTGGVIQAIDAYFINNNRDVHIWKYTNPQNNNANKCTFKRCHFLVNTKINNGEDPVFRIYMNNVRGVELKGNEFIYSAGSAYSPVNRGWGIKSDDASYVVQDDCSATPCTSPVQSVFTDWTMGIEADNCNTLRSVTVDHGIFNSSHATPVSGPFTGGITMHSVYSAQIKRNDINFTSGYAYGISVNNSKNYSINNNVITGNTPQIGVGMYISNSGSGSHKAYRNEINSTWAALCAQYANSNCSDNTCNPDDGLIMNCNLFDGNHYDIAVLGTSPSVRENQGVVVNTPSGIDPLKLVRNRYAAVCGNDNMWYSMNSTKMIKHASHANSTAPLIVTSPLPQPGCSNTALNIISQGMTYGSNDCPENETTGGSTSCALCPNISNIQQAFSNTKDLLTTYASNYSALVDGGNTQAALDLVDVSNTSAFIKSQLEAYSPYLSDTVLKKYFVHSTTSVSDFMDIHNANKPVSASVWNFLISNGLSGTDLDAMQVQQNSQPLSQRRMLEDQLGNTKAELQFIYAEKLNYYLHDTSGTSSDTILTILSENLGDLQNAKTLRINAYANIGDYDRAFAYADSLSDDPEHAELVTLQMALLELDTAVAGASKIKQNPALHTIITNYAADSTKKGTWLARAVLRQVYGNDMNLVYLLPIESSPRMGLISDSNPDVNSSTTMSIDESMNKLIIYPNPSSANFKLYYQTAITGEIKYSIQDILGKEIKAGAIYTNTTQEIDTRLFSNGIYFITLIKDNKLLEKQKLLLTK